MKNKFFIIPLLFMSASLYSYNNLETNSSMSPMSNHSMMPGMNMDNGLMQSMNKMMMQMNNMRMTGDFDLDFAKMMIMHHQSAIDMAEVELAKGQDQYIKSIASNIIKTQKSEIKQLQDIIQNYQSENKNTSMHNELNETMKAMMNKMNSMQMTGDVDKDFVTMMITHHAASIKMAKDELSHGKQNELKKIAEKMIKDQNKEINEFQSWLSNNR
jgi:uncharacterized protein (DUF305 family)